MIKKSESHTCILSTGKLIDFGMAEARLVEKNIPFYKQTRSSTGLTEAMPLRPSMGPGEYYEILVPKEVSKKAKELLGELPIELTTNPEFWHFNKNEKHKKIWRIFAIIILSFGLLIFLLNIVKTIKLNL